MTSEILLLVQALFLLALALILCRVSLTLSRLMSEMQSELSGMFGLAQILRDIVSEETRLGGSSCSQGTNEEEQS